MNEGKTEFYKKAEASLISKGYHYYGEKDIRGKGPQHKSKPDYIAQKGQIIIIGEIKSPKEGPTSSSWRQPQNSDGEQFKSVRLDISQRESTGKVSKEIGGHEIIVRGQLPDYLGKLGKTYDSPVAVTSNKILLGYTFPTDQKDNVKRAFLNIQKVIMEIVEVGNGSTTYIYE
jgi:hypothetical protein